MSKFKTTTSGLRIWHSGKPSSIGARVIPMSEEDRRFWEARDRAKREAGEP